MADAAMLPKSSCAVAVPAGERSRSAAGRANPVADGDLGRGACATGDREIGRGVTPPFVEIAGGHQLFVRDWGAGPPVLLLAGWAMDSRIWGETMMALNGHGLRTIAYDRRGHGRSTDPGTTDYDSLADDLCAVLDTLDLQNVTLVCHSGAGGEAIRYVSRHGEARLARIVLVGATGPRMLASVDNPVVPLRKWRMPSCASSRPTWWAGSMPMPNHSLPVPHRARSTG